MVTQYVGYVIANQEAIKHTYQISEYLYLLNQNLIIAKIYTDTYPFVG